MKATWALVPVKSFDRSKRRLAALLTTDECAELAGCMLRDVLGALNGARSIDGIALLGPATLAPIAATVDARLIDDPFPGDLNAGLGHAARLLAEDGAGTLAVIPGDLPALEADDIDRLLATHENDVTICAAREDGGTNALVLTAPPRIAFAFGRDSAAAHAAAARAAGAECGVRALDAFARDIDRPEDLGWLCEQATRGQTAAFLHDHRIAARLGQNPQVASA